jgi:hypothetical protein
LQLESPLRGCDLIGDMHTARNNCAVRGHSYLTREVPYRFSRTVSVFSCEFWAITMKKLVGRRRIRSVSIAKKRTKHGIFRKYHRGNFHEISILTPPKILSFSKNPKETLDFLQTFRSQILKKSLISSRRGKIYVHGPRFVVDFTAIKEISIPFSVVIAAEFQRAQILKNSTLILKRIRHWQPRVRQIFSELGIFNLLKINKSEKIIHRFYDDPVHNISTTKMVSGLRADGKQIDELQSNFQNDLEFFTKRPALYDGLSEAVENAIAHAYPQDFKSMHPFAGHRWWGVSCLDLIAKTLRFFVFDQGAGIPFTLPKQGFSEELRALIGEYATGFGLSDSKMLRAALEIGRTRTGASNRGLGLHRMSEVVTESPESYLRILSGHGDIVYAAGKVQSERNYALPLGGTLIEWSIPVDIFGVAIGEAQNVADD